MKLAPILLTACLAVLSTPLSAQSLPQGETMTEEQYRQSKNPLPVFTQEEKEKVLDAIAALYEIAQGKVTIEQVKHRVGKEVRPYEKGRDRLSFMQLRDSNFIISETNIRIDPKLAPERFVVGHASLRQEKAYGITLTDIIKKLDLHSNYQTAAELGFPGYPGHKYYLYSYTVPVRFSLRRAVGISMSFAPIDPSNVPFEPKEKDMVILESITITP